MRGTDAGRSCVTIDIVEGLLKKPGIDYVSTKEVNKKDMRVTGKCYLSAGCDRIFNQ